MAKVLIVEDERDLQTVLAYNLKQAGHEVFVASSGGEGLACAQRTRPDLVLLDLMLPDMPGTDVCKTIRKTEGISEIAVVMLTAKGEEIGRVVGFELGADDYVVKPFSVRELLLRIDAILRRGKRDSSPPSQVSEFGLLKIDREWITVLPPGRMLVRVISMVFDRYLREGRQRASYSKVI